eukprot:5496948-Prymnesium_polylepis.1
MVCGRPHFETQRATRRYALRALRRVAACRSVEMIKLAGGAFRRLLEARPIYYSPKVSARRSCTNPRCPQS